MSTLCLDVRNGSVAVGLARSGGDAAGLRWHFRKRLGSCAGRSADELALLLKAFCADPEEGQRKPEAAALSSVVPAQTAVFREACRSAFGLDPLVLGPGVRTGLKIRTDVPSELGTDLVCMAVAALGRTKRNSLVANVGRIITVSAVSAEGEFLGAAIAPGLQAALRVLREEGAQLPEITLEKPKRCIGKNNQASLSAGVLLGWGGLLDRLLDSMAQETGWDPAIVGTGEDEEPLIVPTGGFSLYDPWLALEGLAEMARRNAG